MLPPLWNDIYSALLVLETIFWIIHSFMKKMWKAYLQGCIVTFKKAVCSVIHFSYHKKTEEGHKKGSVVILAFGDITAYSQTHRSVYCKNCLYKIPWSCLSICFQTLYTCLFWSNCNLWGYLKELFMFFNFLSF